MRAPSSRPAAVGASSVLVAIVLCAAASPASAYWTSGGSGTAAAVTGTLVAPTDLTVPASVVADVPLAWLAGAGGIPPEGYLVERLHAGDAPVPACGSSRSAPVVTLGCTDTGVPVGEHTYVLTAVFRTWTAVGPPSSTVTVTGDTRLGAATDFSVLAGVTVASTGATSISGNLGVSPGSAISGFGPGIVGGETHLGDAPAAQAQAALTHGYDELASRTPDAELVGDLGGRTLSPGTYHSTAAVAVTGELTMDAGGDPDAVFVVQAAAALNTAAGSSVRLAGGARAGNVFWVVAGAAGAGAGSNLSGTFLCQGAMTLGAGTVLIGRALSRATVTLAGNQVRFSPAPPPTMTISGGSALTTKDTTPTISGASSAGPGSRVTVTVGGQALSTTVGPDSTWVVTAGALAAGAHDVEARVRAANGDGAGATQVLTVEVNPPVVRLGSADTYSVVAGTAVVSTGTTHLSGDLGVSPSTTVTGFGTAAGTLDGAVHAGDAAAAEALADVLAALDEASTRHPDREIVGDLAGQTFHAGVHHTTAALALTGSVTLDGEGDPDAVFVFLTDAAFDTAAGSTVVLTGSARAANVFWVVTGAAGTGASTSIVGSVLARGAITLGAGTLLEGRALSLGTVTLAGSTLTGVSPAPTPALPETAVSTQPSAEAAPDPSRAATG